MLNHPYNIDKYDSILKSEVTKLTVVMIILFVSFVSIITLSIIQIKKDKSKKMPYIQLALTAVVFMFLLISLVVQIGFYKKDIAEKAYMQYEGPVNIRTKKQFIFGGIPTAYTEYIITFEYKKTQIELSMNENCGLNGDIDNLYIVFSEHSGYILEMEE